MTPQEHDTYIANIKALQSKVEALPVADLKLSREERDALDSLTEEQRARMETLLSAYTPVDARYDFRRLKLEKAIALFLLDVLPVVEEAYRMGAETV